MLYGNPEKPNRLPLIDFTIACSIEHGGFADKLRTNLYALNSPAIEGLEASAGVAVTVIQVRTTISNKYFLICTPSVLTFDLSNIASPGVSRRSVRS